MHSTSFLLHLVEFVMVFVSNSYMIGRIYKDDDDLRVCLCVGGCVRFMHWLPNDRTSWQT